MEATAKKQVQVTLVLDEFETEWLKDLMQNPIHGTLNTEDKLDRKMRKKFWDALNDQSVLKPF